MFCQTKRCRGEKSAMTRLSEAAMLTGGLLATFYFGHKLMEKIRCKCRDKSPRDCSCELDDEVTHEYDHVSENDSLCHDKKDYYGKCGCFDSEDGDPPVSDDKSAEEMQQNG